MTIPLGNPLFCFFAFLQWKSSVITVSRVFAIKAAPNSAPPSTFHSFYFRPFTKVASRFPSISYSVFPLQTTIINMNCEAITAPEVENPKLIAFLEDLIIICSNGRPLYEDAQTDASYMQKLSTAKDLLEIVLDADSRSSALDKIVESARSEHPSAVSTTTDAASEAVNKAKDAITNPTPIKTGENIDSVAKPDNKTAVDHELGDDQQRRPKRKRSQIIPCKTLANFSENPEKTLSKIYVIPNDYKKMSKFTLGSIECNNLPDIKSSANEIRKTVRHSGEEVNEMCEIGRYSLITPVLNAVAANQKLEKDKKREKGKGKEKKKEEKAVHIPQYPLLGGVLAQGYPDWAFAVEGRPIFIIEAKIEIDRAAIAQNVLQMYEAYMKMRPEGDTSQWTMYGMVTTAVEAVFIKAIFRNGKCDRVLWNGDVLQIPHRKDMDTATYFHSIKSYIQNMAWILSEQIGQLKKKGCI
jgi:hypothetical protein